MKITKGKICSKRLCLLFLKIFVTGMLLFFNLSAYAQETMKFDNEAKKFEFIRQMLKKEKYLRPADKDKRLFAPHCKVMMKDLLAGKYFKAIEPDARTDSADDPKLAKWHQCEGKDYHDYDVDVQYFFDWLDKLGDPPYRYYRIELDGNKKNGKEDMIYYNQPCDPHKPGDTGYTWVDLNNCEIKRGFPATGALSTTSKKPNAVYLNTLVYYKKQLWAADFVDGFGFSLFHWKDRKCMETCSWILYKPE